MKKFAILFLLASLQHINAQQTQVSTNDSRVITTGMPLLLVAVDARAAGMGDQGVATAPDTFSQQWNPAKYAFALDKQGFSTSYTPYLTELVNDISLGQLTYYNRINERSAFAFSLRYFSLGIIELRQTQDDFGVDVKPNELAFDGSYSLKLSERFSMAVAGRYIRSQLRIPDASSGGDAKPASTFAVDVAGYYVGEEAAFNDFNGRLRLGFNFSNMGPKINYDAGRSDDDSANFLPAIMRIGGGYDFILDDFNKVTLSVELAKLLVPTPQYKVAPVSVNPVDSNGNNQIDPDETAAAATTNAANVLAAENENESNIADYNKINWVSGIFSSFGDAPGGFSEELKEFTYSIGTEYVYQDSFAMRLGYFHESPIKGARKFFSLGAGFKYNVVKVDMSYLFSASKVKNPLENTLRFSLTFNFGDKYEDY